MTYERLYWYLTVQEVADLLHVKPSWVYGRCRPRAKDPLPFLKIGRYVRFEESAVRQYMERFKKNYGRK